LLSTKKDKKVIMSTSLIKTGTLEVGGSKRGMVVLDMAEKAVVKAMEEINENVISDFTKKVEIIQGKDILALVASLFDFQGFDPNAIIKKLIVLNDYYINVKKLEGESREILVQDVMMMVCANVVMGNLQDKSVGRRSTTGRLALGYLQSKYAIRMGSTGAGLPSDTLTFPRVANSFPALTCRVANVLKPKSFVGTPFKTDLLPSYMRVSCFASLCGEEMKDSVRRFLLEAVCAYSCDQSIVVHEGEKKKRKVKSSDDVLTPKEAYSRQWDYILVSGTSSVPSVPMKKALLSEFLVENQYSVLSDIVKNFRLILEIKEEIPTEEAFRKDISDYISSK
jgi:hypothetical protein